MKNGLLVLIIIIMVFVLSWFLGGKLQNQHAITFTPMTDQLCQSTVMRCEAGFSDAALSLEFVAPVVMSPFVVKMTTAANVEEAYIQFRMKNMDMGIQRYTLVNAGKDIWQTEVILPVCSLGRSDWTATLNVKYQNMWWQGDFDFEAGSQ